jgi:hypothetical protein
MERLERLERAAVVKEMGNTKEAQMELIKGNGGQWQARCPGCGVAIQAQTTVAAFLEQPEWHFWGEPGQRWKLCEGQSGAFRYVHFKTVINGGVQHRVAWLKASADTPAVVQGALL